MIECHIALRGCWCNFIFTNVNAPSEEKSDESEGSFCEELEHVFIFVSTISKFCWEILMQNGERESIFKPKIGNESLHQCSNGNCFRIVNSDTSKNSSC